MRLLEIFHEPYSAGYWHRPGARIASSARIGPRASIAAFAFVGEGVTIGADARLDPHVVIYPRVTIGDRFTAFAGAVVRERVTIGHGVTLQPGVVVGGDGFGYLPDGMGGVRAIPQTGTVILEDGVEIGANTTIDRAAVGATRIRRSAKIDNLVQIGHGCDVGEGALLAAQVGLAGSTQIGAGAQLGGQVGAAGPSDDRRRCASRREVGRSNDVAAGSHRSFRPPGARYSACAWAGRRRCVGLPEHIPRLRRIERRLRATRRMAPTHEIHRSAGGAFLAQSTPRYIPGILLAFPCGV